MRLSPPSIPRNLYWSFHYCNTLKSFRTAIRLRGANIKRLGSGCYRTAYLVDYYGRQFVVKRKGEAVQRVGECRSPKIHYAPTRRINGWEIQHLYTPCPRVLDLWLYRLAGDFKVENVGVDTDGTLVAFDW